MLQCASGTVIGRDHVSSGKLLVGRNNQDAIAVVSGNMPHELGTLFGQYNIGVVCDGCGSSPYSEFGARFAANVFAKYLSRGLNKERLNQDILLRVQALTINRIEAMARYLMADDLYGMSEVINDYFLTDRLRADVLGCDDLRRG